MQGLLQRQGKLLRHQRNDASPALQHLSEWQLDAFREAHHADCERAGYRALFDYYAEYLHSGMDLRLVSENGQGAFKLLSRMDETYPLLRSALEFSVLAQELDDALAFSGLSPDRAIQSSTQRTERLNHAQLLAPLGTGLAPYTRSRIAHATFKVAMMPLRATALAPLVQVLDRGYEVLRNLENVEQEFALLLDNNRRAVERLYPA